MRFNEELFNNFLEFSGYITSQEWKKLRDNRLKIDNFCCVVCKNNKNLICHHITYERLYHEELTDLIILCNKCHNRIHKISPPKDIPIFVKQDVWNLINEVTPEDLAAKMWEINNKEGNAKSQEGKE